MLRNLNRIVGSDFQLDDWRHAASFRPSRTRASRCTCGPGGTSPCAGRKGSRAFCAGERIHTEDSYKYRPADFATPP
ncbi:L-histidine N(alpha)-methyltransferase [Cupriavidus basilensis]